MISTAVSSSVDADTSSVVGVSSASTVIVTVAVLLSSVPSLTLYVKVSVPSKSEDAVYVTTAPLMLVDPFDASLTIEYVKVSSSGSDADKVIFTEASVLVS